MTEEYNVFAALDAFCNRGRDLKLPPIEDFPLLDDEPSLESPTVSPLATKIVEKTKEVEEYSPRYCHGRRSRKKATEEECVEVVESIALPIFNDSPARNTRSTRGRRSQRNRVTEIAARSNTVATIDLITSPIPPINEVVYVDSDDEDKKPEWKEQGDMDDSFDMENPEISIKIKWNGKIQIFKLRKHQKFSQIFKVLAEKERCNMEHLVFNIGNKVIAQNDTPDSINYQIFQFISGRVLLSSPMKNSGISGLKKKDKNLISVKIQSDKWKRPITLTINRTDTLKLLYIKCSEELGIQYKNFKLSFDGEPLTYSETPISELDMEGGEIIDCVVKK